MKLIQKILFITLFTSNLTLAETIFSSDHSDIKYTGRIDFSIQNEPTYVYPGVSIKAKFKGNSIYASIYDYGNGSEMNGNFYKVLIDGKIIIEQLKALNGLYEYELASSLDNSEHIIEIIKITEGASGKSSFRGFKIVGGDEVLLPINTLSFKKIEFIGDSWTCGFGNLSQYSTGQESMAISNYYAKNEDNYFAWGPITARALNADYHITATSGRGLYRNNTGSTNNTIPLNYDNLFEDDPSTKWDHNNFHPDIVVIHIGTNDLALEENGEAFKLDDELFKKTYKDFITKILTYHTCAQVIVCFGNSKSDSWPTWTKQLSRLRNIANNLKSHFWGKVTICELPYTAEKWTGNPADDCGYGDAWHPSLCSHEKMANVLLDTINSMSINWGETGCKSTLDVHSISPIEKFIVYPNPSSQNINFNGIYGEWTIFDDIGKIVLTGQGDHVNLSTISNGIYHIKASTQKRVISTTFMKQ